MNNNQISGGGVIYLQNKPSWPLGRAGRSSAGCTCALTGRFRSSVCRHLRKSRTRRKLAQPPRFLLLCFGFFSNPGLYRIMWRRVARVTRHSHKQRHLSAHSSQVILGRPGPCAWVAVPAHWPGGGGGARCKGIPPPVSVRERHHTELEAPH